MRPIILLVDDEVDLVHVLAEVLTSSRPEFEVRVASSYEEAEAELDRLGGAPLALVVADHRIGIRTGTELLTEVRCRFPLVPAMLLTGQASREAENRAEAVGARVVLKPVALADWLGAVGELVGAPPQPVF